LFPGSQDELHVDLDDVPIDEPPAFTALSYTWNPTFPMHVIKCGEARIAVGHNLWLGLLRLRHDKDQRVLWIDALCINQEDSRERTQQVQLMQRIYRSAAETIIWLGEGLSGVKEAISLAKRLSELDGENFDPSTGLYEYNQELKPFESTGLLEVDHTSWKALDTLFWSPWFTRAWIVQEVALSRHLSFLVGSEALLFDDLIQAAHFISSNLLTRSTGVDPVRVLALGDWRSEVIRVGQTTLFNCLGQGRHCHATVPKDKVYAFLGIASDMHTLQIRPEYDVEDSVVFTRTAKRLIELYSSLDVLNQVEPGLRMSPLYSPSLPSWVPDWMAQPVAWPLHSSYGWAKWLSWKSNTASSVCAVFDDGDRGMTVTGRIVDVVAWKTWPNVDFVGGEGGIDLGRTLQQSTVFARRAREDITKFRYDAIAEQRRRQWHDIALRGVGDDFYPHTRESTMNAFARTIIADAPAIPVEEPLPSTASAVDDGSDSGGHSAATTSYQAWYGMCYRIGMALPNSLPMWDESWSLRKVVSGLNYQHLHQRASYGRCLMVSKRVRYLGLCYPRVRHGDHIVLLHGARTPFILRKNKCKKAAKKADGSSDETWTFLGEAYVHGLMRYEEDGAPIIEDGGYEPTRTFRLV
jgi:hypothetical protein